MSPSFGKYVRERREALRRENPAFSVRGVAAKLRVQPSYLSKVELGQVGPPSEQTTVRLAEVLGEDPDDLLARAGKIAGDLKAIISKRPALFAALIRQLRNAPDPAVEQVIRETAAAYATSTSGTGSHRDHG